MPNLYKITAQSRNIQKYTKGEIISVIYHNIFDFPLDISEMIRWRANDDLNISTSLPIMNRKNYFFLDGKEGLIYKRTLRKRISDRKIKIAQKASNILSLIPSIKVIAITGSLAMGNSNEEGDIDLLIVTERGKLWTTRLVSYALMKILGLSVRKTNDRKQKDKLCLNIWMDESDLIWRKNRNIYTAHEIAQTVPLVNKNKTYEKFLSSNNWILKFWPNSVKMPYGVSDKLYGEKSINNKAYSIMPLIEKIAFKIQYQYMKLKITRETVTPTKALFHPQDWSKFVISRISS